MATPRNPYGLAVEISGHLGAWHHAVQLLSDRVMRAETGVDRMVDSYLFAVAIRQVSRAAEAMLSDTAREDGTLDPGLQMTLDRFETDFADSEVIRNVLTHFDEYEQGSGRLQRKGTFDLLEIHGELGEGTYWLVVSGHRVEVGAAARAAGDLADAAIGAMNRYHVRWVEWNRSGRDPE